jgi:MOSC domain-containing protein YiiM
MAGFLVYNPFVSNYLLHKEQAMKILSINRGLWQKIVHNHTEQETGIYKEPVAGPLEITLLGLAGDVIANQKHHGGPDQALYLYGQADYDWWAQSLGDQIKPGLFGENLTISGLESATFNIGDQLMIGEVVLQVTAPRIPCAKFAARMGDPQFVKKFKAAERPGLYCRVLQSGQITAGLAVTVEPYQEQTVSILEMYRDNFDPENMKAKIHRYLNAPIDIRSRTQLEKWLAEITG